MWGEDAVEAGGPGGERIHPWQNKGDRSLLNTLQGNGPIFFLIFCIRSSDVF